MKTLKYIKFYFIMLIVNLINNFHLQKIYFKISNIHITSINIFISILFIFIKENKNKMTTYFEMQSNFDIYNEDNSISHNRLENIGTLEKPKTFLKSIDGSNVQKLFTNDLTNKDNDNYLSSQNYDSETIQRGFDEFNDDDFSYLKQEIDSYIKADDDESGYNLVFKNKNNHDLIPNNKCKFAFLF